MGVIPSRAKDAAARAVLVKMRFFIPNHSLPSNDIRSDCDGYDTISSGAYLKEAVKIPIITVCN